MKKTDVPTPCMPRATVLDHKHSPMSQKPDRAVNIPGGKEGWRARRQRLPSDTSVMTTGDTCHVHHKAEQGFRLNKEVQIFAFPG